MRVKHVQVLDEGRIYIEGIDEQCIDPIPDVFTGVWPVRDGLTTAVDADDLFGLETCSHRRDPRRVSMARLVSLKILSLNGSPIRKDCVTWNPSSFTRQSQYETRLLKRAKHRAASSSLANFKASTVLMLHGRALRWAACGAA